MFRHIRPDDPRYQPSPVPVTGVFDYPTARLCINMQWVSHLDGVLARLAQPDAWTGTPEQIEFAVDQIQQLLSSLATVADCESVSGDSGMDFLGAVSLDSDMTTVDIAGIPGSYRHLLLMLSIKTDTTSSVYDHVLIQFNDDTAPASYFSAQQRSISNQSTITGYQTSMNYAGLLLLHTATTHYNAGGAGLFGSTQLWLYDYAKTGVKRQSNWQGHSWKEVPTTTQRAYTYWGGAVWDNDTDIITKISILPVLGSHLVAGSSIAVYGVM